MSTNLLIVLAASCKYVSPVKTFVDFVIEVERLCDWKRIPMPNHSDLIAAWENA